MRWALLAVALSLATPASAVPYTRIDYWIGGTLIQGTIMDPDGYVVITSTPPNLNASVIGLAEYGVLRAQANTLASTSTSITTSWRDAITIDAGALNGQQAWMTIAANYNWTLMGMGNYHYTMDAFLITSIGSYQWIIREREAQFCTLASCTLTEATGRVLTTYEPGFPPVESEAPYVQLTVTAPITLGESLPIGMVLSALGESAEYNDGTFTLASGTQVDALNSGYWGGILSVQDADGNNIDYTLTSLSGTDYTRSFVPTQNGGTVPAPGVGALLLAGLIAAASGRRRTRGELRGEGRQANV